ncbi:MAG TPA: prolyl oligopeptidase family serine peptidase [Candidatus Limnocylindrales bacterium]|nr:prolyl oligopeptidase family serine peptidase [Candidatus Limnocylindrales bacterium]
MSLLEATGRARIERLLSVARATRPLPAADGSLYFASNRGGHVQVYRQAAPAADPVAVAPSETRMVPHAHTPLGLLVREDRGGNEVWQLGVISDGALRMLTTDPTAIHQSVTMHPDQRRAGLAWNPGGQADMVLGEIDLQSGGQTAWATPGDFWLWEAWSPDGARAVVMKRLGTPAEASILERDGRMTRLLPLALRASAVEWLEGGILMLTDQGRDFLGLALVDPLRPRDIGRWLFDEEHELEGVVVDPGRTKAALVVNEGIYDGVRIVELDSGRELDRLSLPSGTVTSDHSGDAGYHVSWSPDGSRLFLSWERPTQPAEIYEWPGSVRWTFTADLPDGLVEPHETSYRSFDGLDVPALYYRNGEEARPAVVNFHGGPEGQSRGTYQPVAQMLAAIGVDVLLPNVRGSAGYGLRYQSLDDKTLRWNSVKDGCEAARHLKRSGLATRTAAMGGSYGGFMTLAVLVEDPGLWDAGVDVVGIADWETFFRNMPPWRGVLRINEYGDPNGAEAEFLRQASPIHRAGSIRAPLLVIHGRNDPRVPVGESIQIAQAVPKSELLIFEDEGHGIAKLQNQVTANSRILNFLAAHLL